jgi:hypothetical protein
MGPKVNGHIPTITGLNEAIREAVYAENSPETLDNAIFAEYGVSFPKSGVRPQRIAAAMFRACGWKLALSRSNLPDSFFCVIGDGRRMRFF